MVKSVLNEEPQIQLSQREQQVLELVVTGASNKEIAQKLVISVNTVKVHMRNIFEKLGVQSRTEASTLAIQEGLVSVTDSGAADDGEESAPAAARTFLLTPNPALALPRWQQFYLLAALLLALLLALVPLLTREAPRTAPELPVLYRQAPTPAPVAAQP
ncbi:MAG: DNA-binding response regulator, partial [Chloroflexi bacterium]